MLTTEDKKWLIETIDNRMDVKFAEQNERIDAKFAEQDKRIDEKFDQRFAEQNEQISTIIDARFSSMMDHMDRRFNEIRAELRSDFGAMMKRNDERFDAMMNELRRNTEFIKEQAAENTRYINVLMETDVLPRVAAISETIPAYHETYSKLAERVDILEYRCDDTDQKLAGIKAEIRKK